MARVTSIDDDNPYAGDAAEALQQRAMLEGDTYAWVRRFSPRYSEPRHLGQYVQVLESTESTERHVVLSTPPQHAKSETTAHGIARLIARQPRKRFGYISYEADIARSVSQRVMGIVQASGVGVDGPAAWWQTPEGGGLVSAGIGGPLTGKPIDGVLVVDDPIKNAVEANSPTIRQRHWDWFNTVALTRVHEGASIIVIQTRWHEDDLAGRLIKQGCECINLPAIGPDNTPLWPEKWPLGVLLEKKRRAGDEVFSALYQGQPLTRGGRIFKAPRYYRTLPDGAHQYSIGIDLAYTSHKGSDFCVAVVTCRVDGVAYVVEVLRMQADAPTFAVALKDLQRKYVGSTTHMYAAGIEKGAIGFMRRPPYSVPMNIKTAMADKTTRARPVSAAWNDDSNPILVLAGAPWTHDFIDEVVGFTGVNDVHDDQVDALAASFDGLRHEREAIEVQSPKERWAVNTNKGEDWQ